MSNNSGKWKIELKEVCELLVNSGINIQEIPIKGTRDGKRYFLLLKDIKMQEIDIEQIVKENDLDEDFPIGKYLNNFRMAYNGTRGKLTDEEIEFGESLGVVKKKKDNSKELVFKGKKISQFHIDFINKNLSEILSGKLNNKETLELLKQASIIENETIIKSPESIKRMVIMLLKDKPDELRKYEEMLKHNTGRRNPYKGKIGNLKLGNYYLKELEFKQKIINKYIPQILNGETTFEMIEKELVTSYYTVNAIIEEYYLHKGDEEGLKKYQRAKRKNLGVSLNARNSAKEMREEISQYKVVSNSEFILLSPEEQEEQLMMKIRMEQLREESGTQRNVILTEETTRKRVKNKQKYFSKKNNNGEIYFSDEDIRYMIFRYTTLINKSDKNLDEKLDILKSYKEISEQRAYEMIKSFPAIMGYSESRIKKQLDLLENENLIDYVINKPSGLMNSVNLMYALIQYAKERHKTSDLTRITRSNIFMPNSTLKRLYNTSFDEIKARFPYDYMEEQDREYVILGEEIGKATYSDRSESDVASRVLESMTQEIMRG